MNESSQHSNTSLETYQGVKEMMISLKDMIRELEASTKSVTNITDRQRNISGRITDFSDKIKGKGEETTSYADNITKDSEYLARMACEIQEIIDLYDVSVDSSTAIEDLV